MESFFVSRRMNDFPANFTQRIIHRHSLIVINRLAWILILTLSYRLDEESKAQMSLLSTAVKILHLKNHRT